MSDPSATANRPRFKIAAALLGLFVAAVVAEIGCRIYALKLDAEWRSVQANRNYYFQVSDDPILGYELKPGFESERPERDLHIDAEGRRTSSGQQSTETVTLLGDSVVFGVGHDTEQTIPSLLAARLAAAGRPARVINCGVPGYGFAEIARLSETCPGAAGPVWYVLNLNDFARRDSVYEGADNGLYRIYHRPGLMAPYFARKAVYRYKKHGAFSKANFVTAGWYRWLYEGNRSHALGAVERMTALLGDRLWVAVYPAGAGFSDGGYLLHDIHDQFVSELKLSGLAQFVDMTARFNAAPAELIDSSDHPTAAGNEVVADAIAEAMLKQK